MSWWLDLALMLSLTIALLHTLMTAYYLIRLMTTSCETKLSISKSKLIFKFSTMWASIFILVIMNLSLNCALKLRWKITILIDEFVYLISCTEIKKVLNEIYFVFCFLKKALLTRIIMHSVLKQIKTWNFACWI